MKKIIILSVSLILVINLIIFIKNNGGNKFQAPTFENIKSVRIQPPTSGAVLVDQAKPLYFDLTKKEYIDMTNHILGWLNSGTIKGNAEDEAVSNGGSPTFLVIELKDGTSIFIKSAISTTYKKISNGVIEPGFTDAGGEMAVRTQSVSGQVTISFVKEVGVTNQKDIRVLSPKLKSFIESEWKDFINYIK